MIDIGITGIDTSYSCNGILIHTSGIQARYPGTKNERMGAKHARQETVGVQAKESAWFLYLKM